MWTHPGLCDAEVTWQIAVPNDVYTVTVDFASKEDTVRALAPLFFLQ